ncbi:MAG: delta(1)-pyrroline-2-carboxylate reductase family protein [Pseudoduganella sp.]|nr:delta(1)-pyrroline-2-carboxylate reductase family protein [Pseudoduganella sp.]
MQIFDPAQTARALPYAALVDALARAAAELANGTIHAPERLALGIDAGGGAVGTLLCMPAVGPDLGITKLVTVHAGNARHGLPAIQGEVVVFDAATGRRLALLDGPTVTQRRTAAMTLLGIRTLAPRRPHTVVLIGTGAQAAAHADALVDFFGVARLCIAGSSPAKAAQFAAALRVRHPGLAVTALAEGELAPHAAQADVVIALTTAREPVIPAHLAPHTLAIGVGAFRPEMAEFPPELLHARPVVVDDVAGARHEAGDLLRAGIDWDQVRSIGAVLADAGARGPLTPVFKTVGQAAWDLAAARVSRNYSCTPYLA